MPHMLTHNYPDRSSYIFKWNLQNCHFSGILIHFGWECHRNQTIFNHVYQKSKDQPGNKLEK